ncbi:universal stress protein [Staphylococcus sp. OJ82]|nr:universal stress protein [Staphylococcus sp. OJ82]
MFKNILLSYDFENDFSAIPDYLEKAIGEDSVVVIYHVVTENDFAISVKYYNKQKKDIQYKIDVAFGHTLII